MLKRVQPLATVLGNTVLQYVPSFNYLGIKFDSRLKYETHALECVRQISNKIYTLTKLRPPINNIQALCLYKSKILPYFDYGDIFHSTIKNILGHSPSFKNSKIEPEI